MDLPYCSNCGKEVAVGLKYCGNCGAPMPSAQPQATASQPAYVAPPPPPPQPTPAPTPTYVKYDPRPEGIRLLSTLSLIAGIAVIGFGILLLFLGYAGSPSLIADLGGFMVVVGIFTFVARYGFSNAKRWARMGGYGVFVVYVVLGALFLTGGSLITIIFGAASLAFGVATLYFLRSSSARAFLTK